MKLIYKLMIGALAIVAIFLLYHYGLSGYLSLESIKSNSTYLKVQVEQHAVWSVIIFTAVSTALIAFTLPVTAPIAVVAGYLFSFFPAVLYTMIACMIGTAISFLTVRFAMGHMTRHHNGQQLNAFKDQLRSYGYGYLVTLQLLTVVPYFVINTLAALAGVPFHIFMLTTFLGTLPVIAIYSFAGRQLYMIQSWKDILSFNMLALLVMLGLLAMVPMVIRRFRKIG